MAEVTVASYPLANADVPVSVEQTGTERILGESFPGSGHALSRAEFYGNRTGSPTGNIYAKVYAHTGTYGSTGVPSGAALATSDPVDIASISTAAQIINFVFSGDNRINLDSGTNYFVAVDVSAVGDGSNFLAVEVDSTPLAYGGNTAYWNGSAWTATTLTDVIFYVYGTEEPAVDTEAPSGVGSTRATLNGDIDALGDSTPDIRGFVYDRFTSPTNPGDVAPGSTPYSNFVSESGTFSLGTFSSVISGLDPLTNYYVRAFSHNSSGYSYGKEVVFSTEHLTRVSFSAIDPTDMVKELLDSFTSRGGTVDYDGSSTDDTGNSVSYTFNTNTVLEGIQVAHKLSPADWYWYVDLGTNILHFKQTSATPDHRLIFGRHIEQLDLKISIEEVKNLVYFTGGVPEGETENLFRLYSDAASITAYGQRIERITDNRITLQPTADLYGGGLVATEKDEKHYTTVEVLDGTYDITLFKPGDTVGFANSGNFIEQLVLQIARIDYAPQKARLSLGYLPHRLTSDFERFKRELFMLQSVANPDGLS